MNPLLPIVIAWVSFEILISFILRSNKSKAVSFDKGSILIIWIVLSISITCAIFTSFHFNPAGTALYFTGILIIIIGMVLRIMAILSLRARFTTNIAIQQNHTLKTDGLYKKVRHPSYTGALISFLGLGLTFGNWLSFLILMMPITAVFIYRIKLEERMLIKHFGNEYAEYVKRTKRLIPYVY